MRVDQKKLLLTSRVVFLSFLFLLYYGSLLMICKVATSVNPETVINSTTGSKFIILSGFFSGVVLMLSSLFKITKSLIFHWTIKNKKGLLITLTDLILSFSLGFFPLFLMRSATELFQTWNMSFVFFMIVVFLIISSYRRCNRSEIIGWTICE